MVWFKQISPRNGEYLNTETDLIGQDLVGKAVAAEVAVAKVVVVVASEIVVVVVVVEGIVKIIHKLQ